MISLIIRLFMIIKHLVIGGGGSIGLNFLGILQHLNEKDFWKIEEIENIYATSMGVILAVILALKYDWETIIKYLVDRPWKDIFKLSGKQIMESYYNKGLYDKKVIELAFKPLLEAKDLSLTITLKEFYEYSKIHLHLYTFELNSFKSVELSHILNPDLPLLSAITMSCAIPGVFMPICIEKECFIDGGVRANYPLAYCLMNHNKDEILGLNYVIRNNIVSEVGEESSIIDLFLGFFVNAMSFITNNTITEPIPYEIICEMTESPLSLSYVKQTLHSNERRRELIEEGYLNAAAFLEKINTNTNTNNNNNI